MPGASRTPTISITLLLTICILASCGARSPTDAIESRRACYSAELGGFVVRDEPDGTRQVLLDVLVRGEADEPLDGITLDISIAGPDGQERAHRRVFVDTRGAGPGGSQLAVALEDVEYRPGDGFWVEVRSPVPAEERGEYQEFGAGA